MRLSWRIIFLLLFLLPTLCFAEFEIVNEGNGTIIFKVNTTTGEIIGGGGEKGDKGDPGINGTNGTTPILGVDYFNGTNGINGTNGTAGTIISTCKTTSDINQTTTTLANITSLSFSVVSGNYYSYEFFILFNSSIATNGLKLGVTYPAATVASYTAEIPIAADGVGGAFQGWGTTSGDAIIGTAVQTAATTYMAVITGNILPSANGTVQPQYASEIATNTTAIKQGSFGRLIQY